MEGVRIVGIVALAVALLATPITSVPAAQEPEVVEVEAELIGFREVPPISTPASGEFRAQVHEDFLDYELTFSDLRGAPLFAHIHFGQRGVNGAVVAFLCGGGGRPPCLSRGGTNRGRVTAADIVPVLGQGIGSGDFAAVRRAILEGVAYTNVHSTLFPAGEIRGQIRGAKKQKED